MYIVWALSWWYGAGFLDRVQKLRQRIVRMFDYFSIDLLIKTWFAPFRQISAGQVNGPLNVRWRAFVDRLVSRVIGGIVRTIVIVIGIITIALFGMATLIILIGWLVAPLAPLLGFIAMLAGWTIV